MNFIDREENAVLRAVLNDETNFLGGRVVVSDSRCAAVKIGGTHTCVLENAYDFKAFADKYDIRGEVCVMGAPYDFAARVGVESNIHKTFAYLGALPPAIERNADIKRLAPTLAGFLSREYHNGYGGYDENKMREILKSGSVFGLFDDSKLAGFIGEHSEGGMGLLTVFENYRRRGYGMLLEKFMIGYIMSFGRVPTCDVDITNAPSLALQEKIGMTAADGYTFWIMDYRG